MTEEPAEQAVPEAVPQAAPLAEDAAALRRRAAQERRRRQVFGDVLDEATLDDRPEHGPSGQGDRWLRENVPPHHG